MELKQKIDLKERQIDSEKIRIREEYEQKYRDFEALVYILLLLLYQFLFLKIIRNYTLPFLQSVIHNFENFFIL